MKRSWAALGLVLALSAIMPNVSGAQDTRKTAQGVSLGRNYPNPFNPETRFDFTLGDPPTCTEPAKQYRVTVKIYNVIAQLVAIPVLQGGSAGVAGGQPLDNVSLTCGVYVAYWDGKVRNTGREAPSGVYLYRIEANGVTVTQKMVSVK